MTYLFVGNQPLAKDAKIAELRQKICPTADARQFDYELLHAPKLDAETLKKALISLPVVVSKRLVVVRQCQKLSDQNKGILLQILKENPAHLMLILDFDELDVKSALFRDLKTLTKVVSFEMGVQVTTFKIGDAVMAKNPAEALKILNWLLTEGDTHPLQIMGGLVWYWGKMRPRLPREKFRRGLLTLQETDLNIKRSRLKPEFALEKMIVELAAL